MFVFLFVATVFGYTVYQVDRTAVDGKIQIEAVKEEIKEDFHDVEAFFAKGDTANHDRYND